MSTPVSIEQVLEKEGVFAGTTLGTSMYPMLRPRRDTIVISPCRGRLKKYEVPLYKKDGRYILHRVIKVLPDSYIICGDNCGQKEYGITDEDIIGVLTGFYRGEKQMDMDGIFYRLYVRVWCRTYPLRWCYRRLRWIAGKIVRS